MPFYLGLPSGQNLNRTVNRDTVVRMALISDVQGEIRDAWIALLMKI